MGCILCTYSNRSNNFSNHFKLKLAAALNSIDIRKDFKNQFADIYNIKKLEDKDNKKTNFIYKEKPFTIKYKLQYILHNFLSKKMWGN